MTKTHHLNSQKSSLTHRQHIKTHRKKFADLHGTPTSHDVNVTSSSGTTLRDLLTKTKTTPPPHLTPNVIYEISCNDCTATYVIYEISCNDCTATYNGQTNRPLIKRIKEHESHSRFHLHNPDEFSHNQSASAHHSRTTGHKIAWDRTIILTTKRYKTQRVPHRTHSH